MKLSGCDTKLNKDFIREILKEKCLNCGDGSQWKYYSYELKNGYYICSDCYNLIKTDKELFEFVDPLLFKCISCERYPIKRKKSDMHIE